MEILRPGRTEWETCRDIGGVVPLADVVGSRVRYPAGDAFLVCRVVGLDDAPGGGKTLRMEVEGGEVSGE